TTQQNAALVEEASAAARSMEEQAAGLAQAIAVFRLQGGLDVPSPAAAPAAVAVPFPVHKAQAARPAGRSPQTATVINEADWAEFWARAASATGRGPGTSGAPVFCPFHERIPGSGRYSRQPVEVRANERPVPAPPVPRQPFDEAQIPDAGG